MKIDLTFETYLQAFILVQENIEYNHKHVFLNKKKMDLHIMQYRNMLHFFPKIALKPGFMSNNVCVQHERQPS